MSQVSELIKERGELPSHSNIGGYPLYFATEQGEELCSDCATKLFKEETDIYIYPPRINWESLMYCSKCDKLIESAYEIHE